MHELPTPLMSKAHKGEPEGKGRFKQNASSRQAQEFLQQQQQQQLSSAAAASFASFSSAFAVAGEDAVASSSPASSAIPASPLSIRNRAAFHRPPSRVHRHGRR